MQRCGRTQKMMSVNWCPDFVSNQHGWTLLVRPNELWKSGAWAWHDQVNDDFHIKRVRKKESRCVTRYQETPAENSSVQRSRMPCICSGVGFCSWPKVRRSKRFLSVQSQKKMGGSQYGPFAFHWKATRAGRARTDCQKLTVQGFEKGKAEFFYHHPVAVHQKVWIASFFLRCYKFSAASADRGLRTLFCSVIWPTRELPFNLSTV